MAIKFGKCVHKQNILIPKSGKMFYIISSQAQELKGRLLEQDQVSMVDDHCLQFFYGP